MWSILDWNTIASAVHSLRNPLTVSVAPTASTCIIVKGEGFSPSVLMTLWVRDFPVGIVGAVGSRGGPKYCRIFSSTPGFYPLGATSILSHPAVTIEMSPEIAKCPVAGRITCSLESLD